MHQSKAVFRVLFLGLMAVLLAACSGGSPESTVESFYKAAAKGDVDKAIELISFADVGANEMVQAKGKVQMIVGQLQARIQANDGLDSVEVLSSTVNEEGTQAVLNNRLNYKNGKSQEDRVRLVKEKGDWKISPEVMYAWLLRLGSLLAFLWLAPAWAVSLPTGAEAGDLIFREGTEAVSAMVMAVGRDQYSHVGMLVGEPGNWQVIHATPSEVPGRVDAVVVDSLAFFTDPKRSRRHAVYHVEASSQQRVKAVEQVRLALGVPFRVGEPEGTYCTLLVWQAWKTAGVDLEVMFDYLYIPMLAGEYLLPGALRASPKLRLLPSAS